MIVFVMQLIGFTGSQWLCNDFHRLKDLIGFAIVSMAFARMSTVFAWISMALQEHQRPFTDLNDLARASLDFQGVK